MSEAAAVCPSSKPLTGGTCKAACPHRTRRIDPTIEECVPVAPLPSPDQARIKAPTPSPGHLLTVVNSSMGTATGTWQGDSFGGGGASKCFDGIIVGQKGHECHSGDSNRPWLTADLGSAHEITSVEIWNRQDCCQDRVGLHSLMASQNNIDWTSCGQYTLPSSLGPFAEACNSTARFIRIQMDHDDHDLNLAEVNIYGHPLAVDPDGQQLAVVASAMTGRASNSARACFDGKIGGQAGHMCHSGANPGPGFPWLSADLGSAHEITSVEIWNRQDCCQDRLGLHSLMVSQNNIDWTSCGQYTMPSSTGSNFLPVLEACPATARYVKIQMDHGDHDLNLAEVNIYGHPLGLNGLRLIPGCYTDVPVCPGSPGWGSNQWLNHKVRAAVCPLRSASSVHPFSHCSAYPPVVLPTYRRTSRTRWPALRLLAQTTTGVA
jgi:hypothetical protein